MKPSLTTKMYNLKLLGHEVNKYEKINYVSDKEKKRAYMQIYMYMYIKYIYTPKLLTKIKSNEINTLTLC